MIGNGRYDNQLNEALKNCKAEIGILLVLDGEKGPGLSVRTNKEVLKKLPEYLESLSHAIKGEIEKDIKKFPK